MVLSCFFTEFLVNEPNGVTLSIMLCKVSIVRDIEEIPQGIEPIRDLSPYSGLL